jgi:hypothetical protein
MSMNTSTRRIWMLDMDMDYRPLTTLLPDSSVSMDRNRQLHSVSIHLERNALHEGHWDLGCMGDVVLEMTGLDGWVVRMRIYKGK